VDYRPEWVLAMMNRTFSFAPGSSGEYSSTNYVLRYAGAADWDRLDHSAWMTDPAGADHRADFGSTRYATHDPLENLTTALEGQRGAAVHGYQPVCRHPPPQPQQLGGQQPGRQQQLGGQQRQLGSALARRFFWTCTDAARAALGQHLQRPAQPKHAGGDASLCGGPVLW
jgi:hypothetical protein